MRGDAEWDADAWSGGALTEFLGLPARSFSSRGAGGEVPELDLLPPSLVPGRADLMGADLVFLPLKTGRDGATRAGARAFLVPSWDYGGRGARVDPGTCPRSDSA